MMRVIVLLCALLLPLWAFAEPPLIIKNVTVIDGTGAQPLESRTVVISNGMIREIKPAENFKMPKDATVLDGSGKFLIPGLWDMHMHTALIANPKWTRQVCLPLLV